MNTTAFIKYLYRGKKRKTGEEYSSHSIAVKKILEREGVTESSLLTAAILHDVLEDTTLTKEYLSMKFGETIAEIVDIVSKEPSWHTGFCKMKSSMDEMDNAWEVYPEAILIKMADRLHNIMTIHGFRLEKQEEYLEETETMLIPVFEDVIERKNHQEYKEPMKSILKKLKREVEKAKISLNNQLKALHTV